MSNRGYKAVTAFTKPPIILRKKILQIIMFGLIIVLIGQYLMKSDYVIMTLCFAIVVLLSVAYSFYKYKSSLDYKIKKFIIYNNLYSKLILFKLFY